MYRRKIFPEKGIPLNSIVRPQKGKKQTILFSTENRWSLWRSFSHYARTDENTISNLIFSCIKNIVKQKALNRIVGFPTSSTGIVKITGILILSCLKNDFPGGITVNGLFQHLIGDRSLELCDLNGDWQEEFWNLLIYLHGLEYIKWSWDKNESFYNSIVQISNTGQFILESLY